MSIWGATNSCPWDRTSASFDNNLSVWATFIFDAQLLRIDAGVAHADPAPADSRASSIPPTGSMSLPEMGLKLYTLIFRRSISVRTAAKGRHLHAWCGFRPQYDCRFAGDRHAALCHRRRGHGAGGGQPVCAAGQSAGLLELRTSSSYGFPVRWLRSNLNVRAGVTPGRIRAFINGTRNRLNGDSYVRRADAGEHILESVDFKIG